MKAMFLPSREIDRRLPAAILALTGLLVIGLGVLVAGCSDTATTTTVASATPTTMAVTSTQAVTTNTAVPTTTQAAVTTTSQAITYVTEAGTTRTTGQRITTSETTSELQMHFNIPYLTTRADGWTGVIHVWAPKQGGPWPVVVMLHGGAVPAMPGDYVVPNPRTVAERGAVVFAPVWLWSDADQMSFTAEEYRAMSVGQISDVAAAVRFARATAEQYGGDPENLTLYGFSAGANQAVMEALGDVSASQEALEGAGSAIPDALVFYDPDIFLSNPMFDPVLARDPGVMQLETPWHLRGRRVDFPITIFSSGDPSLSRQAGDPWAKDSWLAVRDPSGDIRRGLEELGVFDGDPLNNESLVRLLAQWLKADGDAVIYSKLAGLSFHAYPSLAGTESLLDALVPDAG
jgi:hypothetical protein